VVLRVISDGGGGERWLCSPVNKDGGGNGAEQGVRAKRGRGEVRKGFSARPCAAFIGGENRRRR
jgi:hypothetical protein